MDKNLILLFFALLLGFSNAQVVMMGPGYGGAWTPSGGGGGGGSGGDGFGFGYGGDDGFTYGGGGGDGGGI